MPRTNRTPDDLPTDVCATCEHTRALHVSHAKECVFCPGRRRKEFVRKEVLEPLWRWAGNGFELSR